MGSRVRPTGIISLIQSLKPVCSSLELSPILLFSCRKEQKSTRINPIRSNSNHMRHYQPASS